MSISDISSAMISNAFLPISGIETIWEEKSGLTSDDIFFIGMLFFFHRLHQSILDAWENFRENQREVCDQKKTGERNRELRTHDIRLQQEEATRLEGEHRWIEARHVETEGDVPLHAGRLHKAKRRFYEGIYIHEGGYFDPGSCQLNLPV